MLRSLRRMSELCQAIASRSPLGAHVTTVPAHDAVSGVSMVLCPLARSKSPTALPRLDRATYVRRLLSGDQTGHCPDDVCRTVLPTRRAVSPPETRLIHKSPVR